MSIYNVDIKVFSVKDFQVNQNKASLSLGQSLTSGSSINSGDYYAIKIDSYGQSFRGYSPTMKKFVSILSYLKIVAIPSAIDSNGNLSTPPAYIIDSDGNVIDTSSKDKDLTYINTFPVQTGQGVQYSSKITVYVVVGPFNSSDTATTTAVTVYTKDVEQPYVPE